MPTRATPTRSNLSQLDHVRTKRIALAAIFLAVSRAEALAADAIVFVKAIDDSTIIPFAPAPLDNLDGLSMDDGVLSFVAIEDSEAFRGIYHSNALSFTKVIDNESAVPGKPGVAFSSFSATAIDDLHIAFRAERTDGVHGIYLGFSGSAFELARPGGDAGGGQTHWILGGFDVAHDQVSRVTRVALRTATQPAFQDSIRLVTVTPGAKGPPEITTVAIAEAATVVPGSGGELFFSPSFSDPVITDDGLYFRGGTQSGQTGIYEWTPTGGLAVVADSDTPIPGGTGTFADFTATFFKRVLAASGRNVAFRASGSAGQQGVYARVDGAVVRIADLTTVIGTGPVDFFLEEAPAIGAGRVAFTASQGGTKAVFALDGGGIREVTRIGATIDGRTWSGLLPIVGLAHDDLVVAGPFADGGFGAYHAVFAPSGPLADIDGDGFVGVRDLLEVLSSWGPCEPGSSCLADLDGDGMVGVTDLLVVLAAWGETAGADSYDECTSARLVEGGFAQFSNVGATDSMILVPDGFDGLDCAEGQGYELRKDVWLRVPNTWSEHMLSATTCNSSTDFDTRIVVYGLINGGGPCTSDLVGLSCSDDAPGCNGRSTASWYAQLDSYSDFLIRIGSRTGEEGNGLLIIGASEVAHAGAEAGEDPWAAPYIVRRGPVRDTSTQFRLDLAEGTHDDTPDCADGDAIDKWAFWRASATGPAQASVVAKNFPVEPGTTVSLAVYDEDGSRMLACESATNLLQTTRLFVYFPALVGRRYAFRMARNDELDLMGPAEIGVTLLDAGPCAWPYSGDGRIATPGIPGASDGACCAVVCDADPYCCAVEWDEFCASAAQASCSEPTESCDSSVPCYVPHFASGGCNDAACCDAVCTVDPFCCDFEWDVTCVELAIDHCATPACPVAGASGSCTEPHGSPGCEDDSCCGLVCAADPTCCDVEWDEFCAAAAEWICR